MRTSGELRLEKTAVLAAARSTDPTRHTCFLSYHVDDLDEVQQFVEAFGDVFIPKVLGVTEDDDFIDSDDTNYVMDEIRERYLASSTVTIVLVGKCTWSRRFVDWEVYSTLRNDKNNKRSGLVAIALPTIAGDTAGRLPLRVADNVDADKKYARYWTYPSSGASLRSMIEEAFEARASKPDTIDNARARRLSNSTCT